MTNVPEIRFKEFAEDWDQRKLGEIAEFSKGNGYSKGDLTSAGTPIILYGRLYTKYETVIENVDTFVEMKEKSVISVGGEVIVPSSGETAEDISRASVVGKAGVILGGDLNIIKPDSIIDPAFLAITISNGNQQKELSKRAQGKSVVHISNSDLKDVSLHLPSIHEQTAIGKFFRTLDTAITLKQHKLESLCKLKEAYLQVMFPQVGEAMPKVRFNGFAGEWIEISLGEILTERKQRQKITDTLPLLAFAAGQGVIDRSERRTNNRDFLTHDAASKVYLLTHKDDIVYNPSNLKYGAIDRNKHGSGVISPIYVTFETTEIPSFVELIVTSEAFKEKALQYEEGTVTKRQSVKPEMLLSLTVMISPAHDEQAAIGNFFCNLDTQITDLTTKVETLIKLKSAYLQRMFV